MFVHVYTEPYRFSSLCHLPATGKFARVTKTIESIIKPKAKGKGKDQLLIPIPKENDSKSHEHQEVQCSGSDKEAFAAIDVIIIIIQIQFNPTDSSFPDTKTQVSSLEVLYEV
ncbi:uncharacterized protein EAE98_002049 [Botrytis deweyae]|uniref:Uncharacterized protein n=1 Tax=Botrytis deweyae TaxID=2478750 RepID=A0ABQ7IW31_9HELO|nr:uncharacterized protein EAE98_002049 [Botrytis deweyae]KAF7935829.1 hypothetical protein EAE98_002049 [Botrytis deweyae]